MNPDKINQRKQILYTILKGECNKEDKKIWNDLMMETLGLSNNLLFSFGVFNCLWNIVLGYLEIRVPESNNEFNTFGEKCDIYDLKFNRIIQNSCLIGTFSFIVQPDSVYAHMICVECFEASCKDIRYIQHLKKRIKSIQTIKKASPLVQNMCMWLGTIDFISMKYEI